MPLNFIRNMYDMKIIKSYHDFSLLGLETGHKSAKKKLNQIVKQQVLFAYILKAINECRRRGTVSLSVAELFCADAFYAMFAAKFGADEVFGFDLKADDLDCGREIAARLGLKNVVLEQCDVKNLGSRQFSIVLNLGGLYHLNDPEQVLKKSYEMSKDFLIVQTIVSLETDDPNYFIAPAPGWTWGHRSSKQWFENLVAKLKYKVVESCFVEMPGNQGLESRGGLFYLIAKD